MMRRREREMMGRGVWGGIGEGRRREGGRGSARVVKNQTAFLGS